MADTINNTIPFVPEGTTDPAAGLNLSLKVVDALLQIRVLGINHDPPVSPSEGDRYIVGTVPTGAWVGYEGKLAQYLDAGWNYYSACIVLNEDNNHLYINVAAGWTQMADVLPSVELAYGSIQTNDNVTAETTTDATPRKILNFTSNGLSNRITPSFSTGILTATETGIYNIRGNISFSGTLSSTFFVRVYKNTTAIGIPCERKLGTGGDVGSASFAATIELAIGDTISAYHWSDDGGTTFTAHQIYLEAVKLKNV